MFKRFIKRPYYYSFYTLFLIIIITIITIIMTMKIFKKSLNNTSFIERQIANISHSYFFHPTYIISDYFDIIKYKLFTNGLEIRNLKIAYERLQHNYIQLKNENKELSKIIKYSPSQENIIATGRILSDPNSFGAGVFLISVGRKSGVKFRDIVTSENGLVGKIIKVFPNSATVLPIKHLSSKIVGRIQNHGSIVLVSGRNFRYGNIDYITDASGIMEKQKILTISDGQSMPSGIQIGTIIAPSARPLKVKFTVDFRKLNYVTVIRNIQVLQNNLNLKQTYIDNILNNYHVKKINNYTPIPYD